MLLGLLFSIAILFLAVYLFAKFAKFIFIILGILIVLLLLPVFMGVAGIALSGIVGFGYTLPLLIYPLIKILAAVAIISLVVGGVVWLFRQVDSKES